jgi:hypothetical protein
MLNPVVNAMAMAKMYPSGWHGGSPWYGSGNVTDYSKHYSGSLLGRARGGLLPGFARGTGKVPTTGGKGPTAQGFDPVKTPMQQGYNALTGALKLRDKLRRLIGERGRIAKLDERIQVAGDLAALASSPAGEEMAESERAKIVRLNEKLLSTLEARQGLDISGLAVTKRGLKRAVGSNKSRLTALHKFFGADLVEVQGVTGKGGRLHDVMITLGDLRATPAGSTPEGIDISSLRSILEGATLGAYAGMFGKGGLPKFHNGGIVPGPIGQERPILATGGERVQTIAQQQETFVGYAYIDLGNGIRERVKLEFDKRERDLANAGRAGA